MQGTSTSGIVASIYTVVVELPSLENQKDWQMVYFPQSLEYSYTGKLSRNSSLQIDVI